MAAKWDRMEFYKTEDGILLEYRQYKYAYTVWATKNKVGIKLEKGGVRKGAFPPAEDCFERALQSLEKYNPFI